MRDAFIRVIGSQFAALPVVLPPFAPGGGSDASKPIVDVHFDNVAGDGRAHVLRSKGFGSDAISLFVFERCENEVSLRAAKIIRAEGSVVQSEWLGWWNGLRCGRVRQRNAIVATDVVIRVNGPLAKTPPLQLIAPEWNP